MISVCLNNDCQIRLSCVNCEAEGFHKNHDLCRFEELRDRLENEIIELDTKILDLINQSKKEFKDVRAEILQTLDLLEAEF